MSFSQRFTKLMGGSFSTKKPSKPEKEAPGPVSNLSTATNTQKANRRLSTAFSGSHLNTPGDHHVVEDKGSNSFLRYFALSSAGYESSTARKTNQDSFISIGAFNGEAVSLFGVFDGHGVSGHLASQYVVAELPKLLNKDVLKKESDVPTDKAEAVARMLTLAFEKVNNSLEQEKEIDSSLSGTTAVAGVVLGSKEHGRKVVMANCGDSRAILAYEDKTGRLLVKELSDDQKPDRQDEMRRILRCGGRVEPLMDENGEAIGPYRVWLANMMLPGLAMARSIGDDIASTVGVHSTPEVRVHHITEKDKFMVVCSDGVFEFLSNEDVVGIVQACNGNGEAACKELIARSVKAWKAEEEVVDDITAIVVYFQKC